MPQFNDTELTKAVIKSFEEVDEPRVKFLMEELVKSMHDFVRRTNLTFGEWEYAIDFLTRVGQKCTPSRQEFILLSDVLGVSMLVDAVNHREREGATDTDVVFGVKNDPISKVEKRSDPATPDGKPAAAPWYLMSYEFHWKPGHGVAPKPMMAAEDA